MCLCLRFIVWLWHAVALESQPITRIGIGIDMVDAANCLFGQVVDGDGTLGALVANMVGDDPPQPSAEGRPDYRALCFF